MTGHPIYTAWRHMIDRCSNPESMQFKHYGGRGIAVCERWQTFENFRDDMQATWRPGLSIDRINNNGGYEPGNSCWATRVMQARNTRRNRWIDTPWGRLTAIEAANRSGIRYTTLLGRLRANDPALFDESHRGRRLKGIQHQHGP
jgi:hypothetical protein